MSRPSRALRSTLLLPLAVLLGVLALSATGCSSDNADKASVPEAGRAGAPVPGAAPAADVAGAPAAPKEGRPPDTARSLVHTAQLDLRVDDVARAGGAPRPPGGGGGGGGGRAHPPRPPPPPAPPTAGRPPHPPRPRAHPPPRARGGRGGARAARPAARAAERAGGFVADQDDDLAGDPSASLTLKVPPAKFPAVLRALDDLGRVETRKIQVEDVTETVVDLDSRIKTAATSVERLRVLLAGAEDVNAVVALESELAQREQQLETLEGQRRALANRVDLATIDVHLAEKTSPRASGRIPGVGEGLRGGWAALVNFLKVLVLVLAAALPFLPFVVVAVLLVRWLVHRRRSRPPRPPRRRPQPAGWPPPGAAGPWMPAAGPVPAEAAVPPPGAEAPATTAAPVATEVGREPDLEA